MNTFYIVGGKLSKDVLTPSLEGYLSPIKCFKSKSNAEEYVVNYGSTHVNGLIIFPIAVEGLDVSTQKILKVIPPQGKKQITQKTK